MAFVRAGEMTYPEPRPGEVRGRVTLLGVNPGETKNAETGWDAGMPFPRVVPHSDRSGVIGALGAGVEPRRVGQRVWVYGPQAYSPFGPTARLNSVIGAER